MSISNASIAALPTYTDAELLILYRSALGAAMPKPVEAPQQQTESSVNASEWMHRKPRW